MKKCTRCGIEKDKTEFSIRAGSKDGLTASCKKCLNDYDKKRANLPHRIEAREKYQKTEGGIIANNRAKKKYIEKYHLKRDAHIILGNAVRDGKIKKSLNCSECNKTGLIHGHHDDYAFPLIVRWLCSRCHTKWHKNNKTLNG